MSMGYCSVCEYCDTERKNDLKQVRCKRYSMYVDPYSRCDTFTNKKTRDLLNRLTKPVCYTNNEKIVIKASPTMKKLRKLCKERTTDF